jgi:hypothetical protein
MAVASTTNYAEVFTDKPEETADKNKSTEITKEAGTGEIVK